MSIGKRQDGYMTNDPQVGGDDHDDSTAIAEAEAKARELLGEAYSDQATSAGSTTPLPPVPSPILPPLPPPPVPPPSADDQSAGSASTIAVEDGNAKLVDDVDQTVAELISKLESETKRLDGEIADKTRKIGELQSEIDGHNAHRKAIESKIDGLKKVVDTAKSQPAT